jgi:alkylglycerol monooxygenase
MGKVIVFAIPVFLLMIAVEFAWGRARGRNTYRLDDAINSMSLGMLSQISGVFTRLLRVGIYSAVYQSVALLQADAFWTSAGGWLLALLFYDLCYYWQHRAGHESAVFWAAHVVHHQSQDYNLSTALRQTSSGALLGWIFYLPMAVAGVPPLVFGVVALIDLLYQFWVHTEHVGKLGWFDRWFCSPSNHRVHHAVNDGYLDRNYGGILVLWDRLFGSFKEEGERCVFGTRSPLNSWDPLWANAQVYWGLMQDSWRTRRWSDKLRVWFKAPGWRPADLQARFPRPAFNEQTLGRYAPPVAPAMARFAAVQFVLMMLAVSAFLWHAESLSATASALWFAVLLTALWSIGAALQGRIGMLEVLLFESAALATATSALGLVEMHWLFKPLTMLLAMAFVLQRARWCGFAAPAPGTDRASLTRFDLLLLAALLASLAGDMFLMVPGFFIPGLVSFLVAHLFYIAMLRQGVPWFPSRAAVAATLVFGVVMVGVLWSGLAPGLKAPVVAYMAVIGLMTAQALGRATLLRDPASIAVAAGACCFMLSDSLLAVNRFLEPLPLSALWVLSSYYLAQILIVRNARPASA